MCVKHDNVICSSLLSLFFFFPSSNDDFGQSCIRMTLAKVVSLSFLLACQIIGFCRVYNIFFFRLFFFILPFSFFLYCEFPLSLLNTLLICDERGICHGAVVGCSKLFIDKGELFKPCQVSIGVEV